MIQLKPSEISQWEELHEERFEDLEEMIEQYLPKERGPQKIVIEAMNYSMMAGGKRMRPRLMQEAYFLCRGQGWIVEPFMIAIEMMHAYSLVHDDLPAMDNDTYRRGRETTHVAYGECMGILAGDGLLNYAYEVALSAFTSCVVDGISMTDRYKMVARAVTILAKKSGIHGMLGGQTADVEAEKKQEITEEELLFIHEHKTAALIEAALMIGAVLAGADKERIAEMEQVGHVLGVAFQIQDDILDVTGTEAELGKNVGSDEKNNKKTYVSCMGLEAAQEEMERRYVEVIEMLEKYGEDSESLRVYIGDLIHRKK